MAQLAEAAVSKLVNVEVRLLSGLPAEVAKLVKAPGLDPGYFGGSSPSLGTKKTTAFLDQRYKG